MNPLSDNRLPKCSPQQAGNILDQKLLDRNLKLQSDGVMFDGVFWTACLSNGNPTTIIALECFRLMEIRYEVSPYHFIFRQKYQPSSIISRDTQGFDLTEGSLMTTHRGEKLVAFEYRD